MDEPSALIIIDALNSKDTPEKLIEYADVHSSAVFAKCIIARTKKSLEHLKSTVERYRKVFDHCFAGENQQILLEQIQLIFNDEDDKCLKVIQKLSQVGILTHDQILKYTVTRLGQPLAAQIVKEALQREALNKWQVITRFHQKPPKEGQSFGEEQRDEDMEDEANKEKPMTLQEYENEYQQCLEKEI